MRTYFERGQQAGETGETLRAGRRTAARADRPQEVLPHGGQLPGAPRGVQERQLVAPRATVDRLLPERRRDHRDGREHRLPARRPDQRGRLRARAGGRDRQGRQVLLARGGRRVHRRLSDLQRHHRARHPARGDEVGRLLALEGDRHVLPDRPVDRHARRGRRPARPRRWRCASTARPARSRTCRRCR